MFNLKTCGLAGLAVAAAFVVGMTGAPVGHAADACTTDKQRDDVTPAEAQALYDCIAPGLIEGYSKAEGVPGLDFRDYKLVTTAPLVSATHGGMFVNHWVNDAGADLYTRWEDMNGAKFPVGTIFAKESFRISKKDGSIKRGPLFLMEKVADSEAPDGWIYTRLFPNGKFQRTNGNKSEKMVFCHDCHAATLADQDAAFFPPEDYRVSN